MKYKAILIFLLIFSVNTLAFCVPEKEIEFTNKVTFDIINCRFNHALNLTDSLISTDPENPLASVLKLAALGMRDVDLEMTVDSSLFLKTFSLSVDKINKYEKKHGVSSYSKTMMGFSKAIHSTYFLRRKMYMSALQNGLDALKIMKDAKELDSSNTDVDFFLGLYDYAKAELRTRLWWVMFWYPGGKKEGIEKLISCSKSACITKNAALLSLSDIYVTESDYTQASDLIIKLEQSFPESRFVYWNKAKFLEAKKKYFEAALAYNKLSNSYANTGNGIYNSLVTRNKEATMYFKCGEREKAATICKAILSDPALNRRDLKRDTKKLLERINEY